jgi:hypothetical protein
MHCVDALFYEQFVAALLLNFIVLTVLLVGLLSFRTLNKPRYFFWESQPYSLLALFFSLRKSTVSKVFCAAYIWKEQRREGLGCLLNGQKRKSVARITESVVGV